MVYIILGMHKSGTTLVSELLHQAGINMVEDDISAKDYDQKQGKMERQTFLKLNHLLLNSSEVNSLDIPINLKIDLHSEVISQIIEEVGLCQSTFENWGFKDPRTCLTYPIWEKFLPEHKIIVIFRHPMQVLEHYTKYFHYSKRMKVAYKALKMYAFYNTKIIQYTSDSNKPTIFINYHDLMTDQRVFQQLEKFVKMPLLDFRKPQKYRKQNQTSLSINLYELFLKDKPMKIFQRLERLKE